MSLTSGSMDWDTTNDDDDDITDASLVGESSDGKRNSAQSVVWKKRLWSKEEDAILKDFVEKNGAGNWGAVKFCTGLSRTADSCRLRWTDHLRPDLKKCPFSPEEEHLIIVLHAQIGAKWSRMAAKLPGRSDNNIKSFWKTRCRKLHREGKPIYPPDILLLIQTHNQQTPETPPFSNAHIPSFNYDMEEFKIPPNQIVRTFSSPPSLYLPPSISNMLPQVLKPNPSYSFSNMFSTNHPQCPGHPGKFNYMSVPFEPQNLDAYQSVVNQLPGFNTTSNGLRRRQSDIYPNMEQYQLQQHELSKANGLLRFSSNSHADINSYNYSFEPSFGSGLMELPSIQNAASNFTCTSTPYHIPMPPQAGPSTDYEFDPIDGEFFNFDGELEIYKQHDASVRSSDLNASAHPMPLPEYATNVQNSSEAAHDLIPRPTVADIDQGYSYQPEVDNSFPSEWLDEDIPSFPPLDPGLLEFINDEDDDTFAPPETSQGL